VKGKTGRKEKGSDMDMFEAVLIAVGVYLVAACLLWTRRHDKALRRQTEQQQVTDEQQGRAREQLERSEALLDRQEALVSRAEALFKRLEERPWT
jgi:hypothetical protein